MNKTFGLIFILKSAKTDKQTGKAPIYLRITIDGVRSEISIKRDIEPSRWIPKAGKSKGTNEESKSLNAYIDTVRLEVLNHQKKLLDANKPVTALAIKNAMLGIGDKGKSLVELMKYHNGQVKALIGKDYAEGTYTRYETSLGHVKAYLNWKYKVIDFNIRDVDHEFITDFEFYLKSEKNQSNNTAVKYIKNFKKVIRIALANHWIEKDPFVNYKAKLREVDREFLTKEEIEIMRNKNLHVERLSLVRDIFVFCCYTGLAYVDVSKLSKAHIVIGMDGNPWINISRTKTDVMSRIPLLQEAKEILDKYSDNPYCLAADRLLPVLSNQKYNAYLKEIADLCKISKNLTTHMARHTFSTTVTLSNNVPIESVSKMLGHTNIRTTQHYAKVVDRKLSEDMSQLKVKLASSK